MNNQDEQQAKVNYDTAYQAAREVREAARDLAAEIYGWSMKPVDRGQVIVGTPEFEAACSTASIAYDVSNLGADVAFYTTMLAAAEAYLAFLKGTAERRE